MLLLSTLIYVSTSSVFGTSIMLKLGLFFVILILACLTSFVSPDAQGDALYALRISLNASSNQLTDWNPYQINPCTWSKVICDKSDNVITLSLSNMNFSGTLTPQLGVIQTLTTLILQGCGTSGKIPKELGNLTSLTMLNLRNNNFSGEIPASLGNLTKLQLLMLGENNLTGTIPKSLSSLKSLIDVELALNGLTGQIPEQLFQVTNYNFTGNNLNCGTHFPFGCESNNRDFSGKPKVGKIVRILAGILGILLIGGLILYVWKRRQRGHKLF